MTPNKEEIKPTIKTLTETQTTIKIATKTVVIKTK